MILLLLSVTLNYIPTAQLIATFEGDTKRRQHNLMLPVQANLKAVTPLTDYFKCCLLFFNDVFPKEVAELAWRHFTNTSGTTVKINKR